MANKRSTKNATASKRFNPNRTMAAATAEEKRQIDNFLQRMLVGAEEATVTWDDAAKQTQSQAARGTLSYWTHACKVIHWLRKINSQRKVKHG